MTRASVILVVLAVAAAAAVLINVALLRTATSNNDPVGKLTPRAHLPAQPATVVRPHTGPVQTAGEGDD